MNRNKVLHLSIAEAKKWMAYSHDPAHNIFHVKSVTKTALDICKRIGYENKKLIEVACWWHDVGRLFSPLHEELSAQIAKYNLLSLKVPEEDVTIVYEAIRFHKWSMEPKTLEGNILRDADKLDFISLKRWETCFANNELEHIVPMIDLIPKLEKILKLPASKEIYKKRIIAFKKGLSKLKGKDSKSQEVLAKVIQVLK